MNPNIQILGDSRAMALMQEIDLMKTLRSLFAAIHAGRAVQPPQTLTLFPDGAGDFIAYPGVMGDAATFGVKLSPYIVQQAGPLITAWTLLMSMQTGHPLLLCDAGRLTVERTAGVTALAVDLLAAPNVRTLAIIGTGAAAEAHLRHVLHRRMWGEIRVTSRGVAHQPPGAFERFTSQDSRVRMRATVTDAVDEADVVLLCTSSGVAVLDPATLSRPALITSISTNMVRAHEIPPAALLDLDVYCDYRATAPLSAGEMVIAREQHGWSQDSILGDLPELVAGAALRRETARHVFFRSIGMGLEDIAVATELHLALTGQAKEQHQ